MQQKYLYILIFILIGLVSCEGNKNPYIYDLKTITHEYAYEKYYPDYYKNKLLYEAQHNIPLRDPENVRRLISIDSNALIPLYRKQWPYIMNDTNDIFKIVSKKSDYYTFQYLFYKRILCLDEMDRHVLFHIEYPLELSGRKKLTIFSIVEYGFEIDTMMKSAYIIWSSKGANSTTKNSNYHGHNSVYMWEINRSTDTIITNLSYSTIKRLYPDFYGVYRKGKYKSITIDESLPSDEFFNKIEFK